VHPEDRDSAQAYHENLLRGTGQGRPSSASSGGRQSPLDRQQGQEALQLRRRGRSVIGINLDVTPLRQAEQGRRESEQRFSDLFRTMGQAVNYLDAKGLIFSANPAADKLFGLNIEEMRGRHPRYSVRRPGKTVLLSLGTSFLA